MASSSKTTRECTRAPKCSILLNNVLAITLAPCSLEVDRNDVTINDPKPQQSCSGKTLFDSFIDNNKSTLHTRLNESLSEVRYAGWIPPYTILIKGPQEEMDVLKEAWRRRFLRSPDPFLIRELGTVKSIDTEIIQQAPFLPLTKAVYEAISALNKNNLPSGQKQVFEYLAHTYQYVHVPKPNVIRDCLGILFREGKVYASEDNEYFVYVDSESERTEGERKEPESLTVKERPKEKVRPQCSLCEEEKGSSSTHARNKGSGKHTEHAHLCEKHKLTERGHRRSNSIKETSSRDASREGKELKHEKKEKKTNVNPMNESSSKKPKEKGNKKSVWGQISGFMKGKSHETTKDNTSKSISSEKKVVDTTPVAAPSLTSETIAPIDNTLKEKSRTEDEERVTPLGASLNEKQIDQLKRSRSFTAQSKKRPVVTRSNSFTGNTSKQKATDFTGNTNKQKATDFTGNTNKQKAIDLTGNTNKQKAIDYDIETQRTNEGQRHQLNEPVKTSVSLYQNGRPASSRETDQSSTADKPFQIKSAEPIRQRNSTCAVGVVRPYTQNSRGDGRPLLRSNSLKDTRKMVVSTSLTPTTDLQRSVFRDSKKLGSSTPTSAIQRTIFRDSNVFRSATPTGDINRSVSRDSKVFGSATPTGDIHRTVSRDSKVFGSATPTSDVQRLRDPKAVTSSSSTLTSGVYTPPIFRDSKMMGSLTPTGDFQRPVMRDSRSVARSLSLREHRSSDITPFTFQRTHVNVHRDYLANESPLKHILTKNTGNTLPVSPHHPNYIPGTIPGTAIQDRSRPSAQNRNSFPNNNNTLKRTSWRTMSTDYDDDCVGTTAKGLLIDDNLRKHDEMFSPIYLHQNHRMLPCDCSETGYSENSCSRVLSDSTEQKSVSSEQYQSSFLKKYKNERSFSIYSTSDNGILLDEISSSCSSEIRSIMNQDNKLDRQTSPYTVAKGEVVLDSSLTFIGII